MCIVRCVCQAYAIGTETLLLSVLYMLALLCIIGRATNTHNNAQPDFLRETLVQADLKTLGTWTV
jgi:hypothetical protein